MFDNFTSHKIFYFLLFSSFLLALTSSVQTQSTRQVSAMERRIETMNRQAKEYEREEMQRESNGKINVLQNKKSARLIRAEIEEDLNSLQTYYNKIVTELQLKKEIGDTFAKESALSIRKHAARLKENLSLPKVEDKESSESKAIPEDTKKSLTALCKHIYEFITNPIFETSTGMNVDHSTRASQSLETIIRFAEKIGDRSL